MDLPAEILLWSLSDLSEAIERKQVSPVEITKKTLQAISEKDKALNSYITVMYDEAMRQSEKAEEEIMKGNYKGSLHGVPIGLKDLIYTKGVKTTSGSEIYKDFIPDYDAEVVSRLKNNGAIIIGKLNMHQFAFGTTGDRSYFGPARNPHNLSKITGGSSSGSGSAIAAGLAYGSIGSDTSGSIRIPASCCGIVGMKPTYGRVSKHGVKPLSWTLDHLGPMTRTVRDNALLLNAIAGFDKKDPNSANCPIEDFTVEIGKSIRGLTIGVPKSIYSDSLQQEVQKIFKTNVEKLKTQGANIEYIHLDLDEIYMAQQIIIKAEAYAALETEIRVSPKKIDDEVLERVITGKTIQASDYIRMFKAKNAAVKKFSQMFKKVDIIMTPTLTVLPFNIDQRVIVVKSVKEDDGILKRLTAPLNLVGFPTISVPGGKSKEGLPVGIQLIGRPFEEKKVYQFAYCVENEN